MNHAKTWTLPCWLVLALAGCKEKITPVPAPAPGLITAFDVSAVGTIHGQVSWEGDLPQVPPFQVHAHFLSPNATPQPMRRANPHAPQVHPAQRGVANAVVFLRGVAATRARFWSHPPVRVELWDYQLDVVQGRQRGLVGFVRRGDPLEMVASKPVFHSLRAQGAAFFTLPFVEAQQITRRPLEKNGLVELSSGAGYYWMRGYLFVDEHPYYARTDAEGRYVLEQVPPGPCTIVCWLPNWHVARQERDPESSLVTRVIFAPALEQEKTVELQQGQSCLVNFSVSASNFAVSQK